MVTFPAIQKSNERPGINDRGGHDGLIRQDARDLKQGPEYRNQPRHARLSSVLRAGTAAGRPRLIEHTMQSFLNQVL